MLADEVVAAALEEFNVVELCRVAGRREEPVGPPALVQGPEVEERPPVERQPQVAVRRPRLAHLAHRRVGPHLPPTWHGRKNQHEALAEKKRNINGGGKPIAGFGGSGCGGGGGGNT